MFTGIIEYLGKVVKVVPKGNNLTFYIESDLSSSLKVDESVSHNGICLTIEEIVENRYQVSAVHETIIKTNIRHWVPGTIVNLEKAMTMNGKLDGHIVQGHVDDIAVCINAIDLKGSWEFTFSFDSKFADLIIEKGSICLNGVSLTVYNVTNSTFSVSIIPYTFTHTSFNMLKKEEEVNVEFDILGKYVKRMLSLNLMNR